MSKGNIEAIYPLSPAQQGMLFETVRSTESGIHLEQVTWTLQGHLDFTALKRAWQHVIDRHAILRTGFVWQDQDEPLQVALRRVVLPALEEDWSALPPREQDERLDAYLKADRARGFELSQAPLLRLALFRMGEDVNQIVWTYHHILLDGWCSSVLSREVLGFYQAASRGQDLQLKRSRPYRDYIAWLKQQDLARAEAFWRARLENFTRPTPLGVPAEPDDAPGRPERYGERVARLPATATSALQSLARRHRLTLNTIVQGIWGLLLSRYSGEQDVVFGTTVSGRPPDLVGVESMIGLFTNTLPMRVEVPPDGSLWPWLEEIQAQHLDLRQYEYSPGGRVHQWSQVPGALPLYETILVFENFPVESASIEALGLTIRSRHVRYEGARTKYALTFLVQPGSELTFGVVYDSRRLDGDAVARILEHFLASLTRVASDPEEPLAALLAEIPAAEIPRVRPAQRHGVQKAARPFVAPGTPIQEVVAGICAEVLGLERVSIHDDFFELGGHSLLATQLVSRLRQAFHVELPLRKLFEEPTAAGLAAVIEAVLLAERDPHSAPLQPIPRDGDLPLSFGEERMWFAEQLAPGSTGYNEPGIVRVTGPLNVPALEQALNEIVRRHEVLRTTFASVDGRPLRIIAPTLTLTLPVIDLSAMPRAEQGAEMLRLAHEEGQRSFDLTRGPLLRITRLLLGEQEQALIMNLHHIISDGWSLGVLVRELGILYQALSTGQPSPLPELPIQFVDFAAWQRQWLQGEVLESRLAYWKQQLGGRLPVLELPTDRPRPAVLTMRGATKGFTLPPRLSESLNELSRRQGVTLFMTLLAAFKVLLGRYTGQDDVVLGSPIAGRTRVETEGLIGCLMNPLVLRTDLSGDPSFAELLGRVREMCLGAYAHQDLPFEALVKALRPKWDRSRMPLFQALFILQNAPFETTELPGLVLSLTRVESQASVFDLTLSMWEAGQQIGGTLEYSTDLFERGTIERMLGHFQTVLESVAADPAQRIADVAIMPTREQRQVLVEWNETGTAHSEKRCLQQLFEAQVERTPEAVAVACPAELGDGAQLTYRELNRRANQLAHHLRSLGVGPEARVGLCVERSPAMVVGILGILKAGGAYVPLDPAYPAERLAYMLEDAGVVALVTHGPSARQGRTWLAGSGVAGRRVVDLDAEAAAIAAAGDDNPVSATTAANAAYVIYTSGSTGRPKGVVVAHRGVVNHNLAVAAQFGLEAEDRVLQFHSLSFDGAVEELFPTWFSGGTVVLRAGEVPAPGTELARLIEDQRLTVLNLPTAYWHAWVEELAPPTATIPESLRAVIVGGEKAAADHLRAWRQRAGTKVRWINTYGPTEATVIATLHEPGVDAEAGEVPIGRPIANTRTYLLDRRLRPVPIGVAGELHIGGVGVARGYLNRPDLTAEKFIPDPVGGAAGERLYKTGDLARYRADGALEYLGRVDEQVKIRGFRIEPGEIEAVLSGHPGVRAVVVVAREDTPGDTRLVAYVVPGSEGSPDIDELRSFAQTALPAYLVPSAFMLLDALPYTTSGKIDRQALPAPTGTRPDLHEAYVEPRTPVEQELARIWSDLLGLERVGVHDNFFDLGGHSLLATRLISRARAALQVDVPLRALFESPTIAGLSQAVEFSRATGAVHAVAGPDLAREAVLDPEITAEGRPFGPVVEPASILLTGATGFLGPFLLHELLDQTRADVYCLVRAGSPEEGRKRLEDNLAAYSLWDESTSARIIPVPGDLGRPRLGLAPAQWDELASRIDVIYHNGALVNGLYPYSALKAPNVLGTQEVLRLASRFKVKPVHHVSTMSVFPFGRYNGGVVREDDPLDDPDGVQGGYAQSKWVAEKLISIGRSRGIPATIYRPGWITGHSQTGVSKTDDPFHQLLASWIELGSVPRHVAGLRVDMTPVDYVSQAVVRLSRRAESLGKAFHLVNPHPIEFNELTDWLQSFGYPLRYVSLGRWAQEWIDRARESKSPLLAPLLHLSPEITSHLEMSEGTTIFVMPRLDCQGTLDALRDSAVECPPVDAEFLRRYFSYFIRSGLLATPGARDARDDRALDSR